MRSIIRTFGFSILFCCLAPASHRLGNAYALVPEAVTVFTGRTPCDEYLHDFLEIPPQTDCEMIRWELSLYRDADHAPSRFHLKYNYGMNQPNTEEFTGGGNPSGIKGTWKIQKGTKISMEVIVYRLVSSGSSGSVSLVRLNDKVIHFLYSDGSLMIGNASYSYTLYRINA